MPEMKSSSSQLSISRIVFAWGFGLSGSWECTEVDRAMPHDTNIVLLIFFFGLREYRVIGLFIGHFFPSRMPRTAMR
jgi:hypothetical protein